MCEIVGSETAGRPGQHTARGTGRLTDLPTPQPHTYQINYTDREDRLKPHVKEPTQTTDRRLAFEIRRLGWQH